MDNPKTNGQEEGLEKLLDELREEAIKTNKEWAEKLGIPQSRHPLALNLLVQLVSWLILIWYTRSS